MEEGCENNSGFDYSSLWEDEEKKKEKRVVKELPRGYPRQGIKGKYLKKKNHVGRVQLKRSWGSYFESGEGKDIVKD